MLVSRNGNTRLKPSLPEDDPFGVKVAKPRTMTLAPKRSLQSKSKPTIEEVKRNP